MATYDPIYISLSDSPVNIVASIDNLKNQVDHNTASYKSRRWLPLGLFLAGFPFLFIDCLLGYGIFIFIFVTPVLWVAALLTLIKLKKSRSRQIPPAILTVRNIIHTLRDDIAPGRNFFGHVDTTGARQASKAARETRNMAGMKVTHYRDEWFALKTKLYDGNMLRLSVIERVKVRNGYWKRGSISGKQKWKPDFTKADFHQVNVRISVNPQAYEIVPNPLVQPHVNVGNYFTYEMVDTAGGIISLSASTSASTVGAEEILAILKGAYSLLKFKTV